MTDLRFYLIWYEEVVSMTSEAKKKVFVLLTLFIACEPLFPVTTLTP